MSAAQTVYGVGDGKLAGQMIGGHREVVAAVGGDAEAASPAGLERLPPASGGARVSRRTRCRGPATRDAAAGAHTCAGSRRAPGAAPLGQLRGRGCTRERGRTVQPGVVAAAGDAENATQDAHGKLGLLRRDEGEPHWLCLAKKAVAFFRMSRSIRSSRFSRRRRRSSLRSSSVSGTSGLRPVAATHAAQRGDGDAEIARDAARGDPQRCGRGAPLQLETRASR